MLDLTPEQIKQLTIWAYDRLWDMMDNNSYEGDNWFTVNGLNPLLDNKLDINIWDNDEDNDSIIHCAVYEIVYDDDNIPNTKCDNWIMLF